MNNKEKLLVAGIKLFAENDYELVTNKMITDMVGINSAMVSYYFQSKENFYLEVIKYSSDKIILAFETFQPQNLETSNAEELLEQISYSIDVYLEAFFSDYGQFFAIIYHRNLIKPNNLLAIQEYNRPIETVTIKYTKLFDAYYKSTRIEDINADFVLIKVASIVYFMIFHSRTASQLAPQRMNDIKNIKTLLLKSVINGY